MMSYRHFVRRGSSRYLVAVFGVALLLVGCFLLGLLWEGQPSGAPSVQQRPIEAHTALSAPAEATPTSTPDCLASWSIVSSPSPSASTNYLQDVTAVSPTDVWSVGTYNIGTGSSTLALHWDGNQWSQIPSPNPYPGFQDANYLIGVGAVSSDDVWAVGFTHPYGGPWLTLIEHWNGVQWSVVPSPSPGVGTNYLTAISGSSASDLWAVGYYINNQGYARTLIEHWDSAQWSIVVSPNVGSYDNVLWNIQALTSNDAWAVGYSDGYPSSSTLIEHWNGVQWSVVPSPNPAQSVGPVLYGISGTSFNDVWAVGDYGSTDGSHNTITLVEHWDGTQWTIVPSPNLGGLGTNLTNELRDVSAFSQNDAWVVGYFCCTADGLITMIQHWDGAQWSVVPSPNPSMDNNHLQGVAVISGSDVWAVGYYGGAAWQTLTEHYASPCSTPTPAPTHTPSLTRTSTPTQTFTPNAGQRIVGHVTWQSIPQPDPRNSGLTATLSLCVGGTPSNSAVSTDASGYFTLTTSLPNGTYNWHLKGSRWLATNGTLTLSGGTTSVEMGLQRAGDADGSNLVNGTDFVILKSAFGGSVDLRADFNNDGVVNGADFTLLRGNFGVAGAPPNCP